MAMHVDYTNKGFFQNLFHYIMTNQFNIDVVTLLGYEFHENLYHFICKHKSQGNIMTFINDKNFELIDPPTIDSLCMKIALSGTRTRAIIVDNSCVSPLFYKKLREIASATGSLLILKLTHLQNINKVIHCSLPNYLVFNYAGQYWLGFSKNTNMNKIDLYQIDDKSIYHINQHETDYVYNEIFNDQCYDLDKLNLPNNAIIFDVGANIGLFSLYCLEKFPQASLFAFEPSYAPFQALQLNMRDLNVYLENSAISDRCGQEIFHSYPDFSVVSGFNINQKNDLNTILTGISSVTNMISMEDKLINKSRLNTVHSYICERQTISSIIASNNINHIDLIKIDTEGSELDILHGIKEHHWGRIDQFYIETHHPDITNKVIQLLTSFNYLVMRNCNNSLSMAGIETLLARRAS